MPKRENNGCWVFLASKHAIPAIVQFVSPSNITKEPMIRLLEKSISIRENEE